MRRRAKFQRIEPMTRSQTVALVYDLQPFPVLGKRRAQELCDAIWKVDKLKDARKLRPLLQTF